MTLYGVILIIIHALISFIEVVGYTWQSFRRRMTKLMRFENAKPGSIRRFITKLHKIPVHLGIVIVEDDIFLIDIARTVVWSAALGVAYVTIYDPNGKCKRILEFFRRHLEEQQRLFEDGGNQMRLSIILQANTLSTDCVTRLPADSNGVTKMKTLVRVVGPEDGMHQIVNVTRQLSASVSKEHLSLDDITSDRIDSMLSEGFCDPDLIIKFGKVNSLLGFLPWQVRLSEILIPSVIASMAFIDRGNGLVAQISG